MKYYKISKVRLDYMIEYVRRCITTHPYGYGAEYEDNIDYLKRLERFRDNEGVEEEKE